jgi:hypothetical protein
MNARDSLIFLFYYFVARDILQTACRPSHGGEHWGRAASDSLGDVQVQDGSTAEMQRLASVVSL